MEGEPFDRVLLAFVLGEVRDRAAAAHELYAALKPGGILSVTEGFGDPDYRRPTTVRHEVEPAGFRLVERFGGFPAYTLNFQKPEKEEVGSVVVGTPGTGASVLLPAIGGVLIGLGLVDGEDEHGYSRGHLGMHQTSPGCIRSLKVSGNR